MGEGPVDGTPREEEEGEGEGKEREGEEGEGGSKEQVTNQTNPCWFSGLGGVVNGTEVAAGKAAFRTPGLASGTSRCSGSCHVSAPLGFWLLKCHSSSVSRIDLFSCKS